MTKLDFYKVKNVNFW